MKKIFPAILGLLVMSACSEYSRPRIDYASPVTVPDGNLETSRSNARLLIEFEEVANGASNWSNACDSGTVFSTWGRSGIVTITGEIGALKLEDFPVFSITDIQNGVRPGQGDVSQQPAPGRKCLFNASGNLFENAFQLTDQDGAQELRLKVHLTRKDANRFDTLLVSRASDVLRSTAGAISNNVGGTVITITDIINEAASLTNEVREAKSIVSGQIRDLKFTATGNEVYKFPVYIEQWEESFGGGRTSQPLWHLGNIVIRVDYSKQRSARLIPEAQLISVYDIRKPTINFFKGRLSRSDVSTADGYLRDEHNRLKGLVPSTRDRAEVVFSLASLGAESFNRLRSVPEFLVETQSSLISTEVYGIDLASEANRIPRSVYSSSRAVHWLAKGNQRLDGEMKNFVDFLKRPGGRNEYVLARNMAEKVTFTYPEYLGVSLGWNNSDSSTSVSKEKVLTLLSGVRPSETGAGCYISGKKLAGAMQNRFVEHNAIYLHVTPEETLASDEGSSAILLIRGRYNEDNQIGEINVEPFDGFFCKHIGRCEGNAKFVEQCSSTFTSG